VACCCELPGETSRRWEAALELREVRTEVVATDAEVAATVGVEQ
jgi:hypothetical protein